MPQAVQELAEDEPDEVERATSLFSAVWPTAVRVLARNTARPTPTTPPTSPPTSP